MKELYFDLAGKVLPYQLPNITQCVDMDKIIYGSDAPYTIDQVVTMLDDELERTNLVSHHELEKMFYDNGKPLLKQLKKINSMSGTGITVPVPPMLILRQYFIH